MVNKQINGSQCTIIWHVDDLKISHKDQQVVTSIIKKLDEKYGDIMPLSVSRGKVHEYLGMVFDYTVHGQVKITMCQYINERIKHAPQIYKEGIGGSNPAPMHLFNIRDANHKDTVLLSKNEKEEYHSLKAKCLYLSKRERPNIQQSIAFHCTRVQNPDEDDQKKLGKTIKYLMETAHLPLILSMDKRGIAEWWVDALFAIHDDMRSRTGATGSLGRGSFYAASSKQKIMAASSTEAELVGVADTLPKILWCRLFLEDQGCTVEDVYVYQDNQSAILLEKNGMRSVGKGTRHIKIKYFFVTEKLKNQELQVIYCPTKEMLGDFFTKPIQGSFFIAHRDNVLGINKTDYPLYKKEYAEFVQNIIKID